MAATSWFSVFLLAAAAICLVLLPNSAHATPVDFEYCGNEAFYQVKVHQVDDPAVLSRPITFNISASTDGSIYVAEVTMEVSFATIRLYSETTELCEDFDCPIPSGNFTFSEVRTLRLPPYPFYTVKMTLEEYGLELTCIRFRLAFGLFPSMLSY